MINQIQFSLFLVLLKIKYLCTGLEDNLDQLLLLLLNLKSLASPPVFRPRLWWAWNLQGQHWNMWDDIQNSLSKLNWKYSISSFPRCTQYFKPIPEPQVAFFWWVTRLLISFSSLVTSTLLLLVMQSVMPNTGHVSRCHVSRVYGWLTWDNWQVAGQRVCDTWKSWTRI